MRKVFGLPKYMILIFYSIITVVPFLWVLSNSLKSDSEIFATPLGLPKEWKFENFAVMWTQGSLGVNFMNSVIISFSAVFITLLICSMASYVIARVYPSLILFSYFGLGIMIPSQSILIPSFILLKYLDLLNTRTGLIIEYVVGSIPITIFILVAYMKSIPKELEEAAFVDGATRTRIFFSVILPISAPALATVGILAFLSSWNEYMFAYVLISDPNLQTLTQGVYGMKGEYSTDFGLLSAGLAIIMIPVVIVYIFFQEQVVKGMTAGATKG